MQHTWVLRGWSCATSTRMQAHVQAHGCRHVACLKGSLAGLAQEASVQHKWYEPSKRAATTANGAQGQNERYGASAQI